MPSLESCCVKASWSPCFHSGKSVCSWARLCLIRLHMNESAIHNRMKDVWFECSISPAGFSDSQGAIFWSFRWAVSAHSSLLHRLVCCWWLMRLSNGAAWVRLYYKTSVSPPLGNHSERSNRAAFTAWACWIVCSSLVHVQSPCRLGFKHHNHTSCFWLTAANWQTSLPVHQTALVPFQIRFAVNKRAEFCDSETSVVQMINKVNLII